MTERDNFNFVVKLMKENNEDYALHDVLRLVRELTMDVCHKLKQTEKGIELLQSFIKVLECIPTKDPEGKMLVYQDLGMLYYEQRDLDNAEKYFSQCHAYADGSTNIQYKLDSIQNLARVYIDSSDWEKAHRWTYQQISLLNGSKDRVQDYQARKFNALFQLSEICLKLQNWKLAESCLCDCLKLATLPAKQLVYRQFMALYGDERAWISLGRKYCASNLLELANQSEADGQKLLNLITDNKKNITIYNMLLKRKLEYTQEEGTAIKRAKLSIIDSTEETSSDQTNNYYIITEASIETNLCLWLHQREAYHRIHVALQKGNNDERRGKFLLVTLPTGTGKSGLAYLAPFGLKGRVLIITHNTDGVSQLFNSLKFLKDRSVISKDSALPRAFIIRNTDDLAYLPLQNSDYDLYITNIHKFVTEGQWKETLCQFFSMIVIDEGHHVAAKTYNTVVVNQLIQHKVPILLLTATPRRRDKLPLHAELVYSLSLKEAIERKLIKHPCLVRYHPNTNCELSEMDAEMKRLSLKKKKVRKQMLAMMIDILEEKRQTTGIHHPGIVVCATKEECNELGNLILAKMKINGHLIRYATYHSGLSKITRDYVKNQMINQELDCVIHCGLMTEGHDYPQLSVTVIMCNVNWVGRFSQIVGRCTRYLHQSPQVIDNTAHIIINSWTEKNLWNNYQNELHAEVPQQQNSFPECVDFEERSLLEEEAELTRTTFTEETNVQLSIRQQEQPEILCSEKSAVQQVVSFADGKWSVEAFKTNNKAIMNQISHAMNTVIINSTTKKVAVVEGERHHPNNRPTYRSSPIYAHPYNYHFPFMRSIRPQELPVNAASFDLRSLFRKGKPALEQPSGENFSNNNNYFE